MNGTFNVVSVGGGGAHARIAQAMDLVRIRSGLKINYSAVVGTLDSGGKSGERRPVTGWCVGDVRRVASALMPAEKGNQFEHRSTETGIPHGQLVIERYLEEGQTAARAMRRFCREYELGGMIIPATFTDAHVYLRCVDGHQFDGEDAIYQADVVAHGGVDRLWISPHTVPNPDAVEAIASAEVIIIPPGTLLCSLKPTIMTVKDALLGSDAKFICFPNLFNRKKHMLHGATVDDHLALLEEDLRPGILSDVCINTAPFPDAILQVYGDEAKAPSYGISTAGRRVHGDDLVDGEVAVYQKNDVIAGLRSPLSHHPASIARMLDSIFRQMLNPGAYE